MSDLTIKRSKNIANLSDAEFSEWLAKLPTNLKDRVHGCAFRYGLARKAFKAARNNEAVRQRVDDRRVALHHALDAAFVWISSAYESLPSPPETE